MSDNKIRHWKRSDLIELVYKQQEQLERMESENLKLKWETDPEFNNNSEEDPLQKTLISEENELVKEKNRLAYNQKFRKVLMNTIGKLIVIAAVAVLIATRFLPIIQVSGVSMEPTLMDGDIVILEKTKNYETGDLIGFYYQNKILLKRVIGSAGDFINIDAKGHVYVNDVPLEEPYISEFALGDCDIELPYQVPDNKVFVMGDHRVSSVDSRNHTIGCVAEEQVIGRIRFRIWPLSNFGFLK